MHSIRSPHCNQTSLTATMLKVWTGRWSIRVDMIQGRYRMGIKGALTVAEEDCVQQVGIGVRLK